MKYFDIVVTKPILWVIDLCHQIVPNYVIALIFFTIIIRLILFPFSLWSQVQSVKLAKLKPQLDDIKAYHSDDWRLLLKEQKKLYKKEHYSSFVAMLPLILQIPIIIGVIRGLGQAQILSAVPNNFFIPLLSAVSAFALCYVQNYLNVLAKEMGFFSKWGLAIFLTIFSLYFTITSGLGFGIYWISGNIIAIGIQFLCNLIYDPKKYITYKLLPRPKKDKKIIKLQKEKQKTDMGKFSKIKKHLVFYSEKSGFYKIYKGIVNYILEHSKIHIHYLTSDINDQVFNIDHPRFHAYYCGTYKLIVVMMKLNCKMAVMTMPDLQNYQYKRSIVAKNIEYVYVDHGFGSLTLQFRKHAFDYFDTIFCNGPKYNQEIRAMEKFYDTKEKKLINTGFSFYNDLLNKYTPTTNDKITVIIAPSWQKDNIFESCIDDLMRSLSKFNYRVILRPHPEFIKRFPQKIEKLKLSYNNELQLDFSVDILNADLIITDWSSIAFEFSYVTNKPSLFINTPMKILNSDWDKFGIEPLEIELRNKIGVSIDIDKISEIDKAINTLESIENPRKIIQEMMYENKYADKIAGEYIIRSIKGK